jgi:aerobic carbon-monoxide dehydrogenase medium subunit
LEEFLVGSYTVALEPDELLTEVVAQPLPAGWSTAYERVEQFYRPTLNVAAAVKRSDGHLEGVRLAVGCIGPRTFRLRELEGKLQGAPLAEVPSIVDEAAGSLEDVLQPIGDLLGSAEYKLYMTRTLLKQTIGQAAKEAGAHG